MTNSAARSLVLLILHRSVVKPSWCLQVSYFRGFEPRPHTLRILSPNFIFWRFLSLVSRQPWQQPHTAPMRAATLLPSPQHFWREEWGWATAMLPWLPAGLLHPLSSSLGCRVEGRWAGWGETSPQCQQGFPRMLFLSSSVRDGQLRWVRCRAGALRGERGRECDGFGGGSEGGAAAGVALSGEWAIFNQRLEKWQFLVQQKWGCKGGKPPPWGLEVAVGER